MATILRYTCWGTRDHPTPLWARLWPLSREPPRRAGGLENGLERQPPPRANLPPTTTTYAFGCAEIRAERAPTPTPYRATPGAIHRHIDCALMPGPPCNRKSAVPATGPSIAFRGKGQVAAQPFVLLFMFMKWFLVFGCELRFRSGSAPHCTPRCNGDACGVAAVAVMRSSVMRCRGWRGDVGGCKRLGGLSGLNGCCYSPRSRPGQVHKACICSEGPKVVQNLGKTFFQKIS